VLKQVNQVIQFFKKSHKACRFLYDIINNMKLDDEAINNLEARTANLADCFINIVKLAAAINRILMNNNICEPAIAIFNKCYAEFDIEPYLLAYFLHSDYRENNEIFELNDILESFQFLNYDNLEIKSIVNLSNTNFDEQDNVKEISHTVITQGSGNMDFEPSTIVESEFRSANLL
ncbi:2522_t:CDS:2, partial [Cetraspora pellucida]